MTLQMHSLEVDVSKLMRAGSGLNVPRAKVDVGYLVHSALATMTGNLAPRPFCITSDTGRTLSLLGYSAANKDELQSEARACAEPRHFDAIRWDRHACKPMPTSFREGQRFKFSLRACPVVRRRSANGRSVEVDAFLGALGPRPEKSTDAVADVERLEVYRAWLESRIAGKGFELCDAKVTEFQLRSLVRRTKGTDRKARLLSRPDVRFEGTLEVRSSADFLHTLEHGIGRHKAFGFGMLLLKPAR